MPSKAGIPRDLCTAHAAEVARFILDRPENRELVWALELADARDRIDELALGLAAERRRAAELEAALRERFFSELPEYDYERYDGVWGWHEHPWFQLLGLTDEECQAALAERKPAERQCLICFDHGDPGSLVAVHAACLEDLEAALREVRP